uniref:Uncharacterized protein n=1 Tax=Anopheles atroparvus TaxID=41427 RepID=A0A182ISC6_ANOAO
MPLRDDAVGVDMGVAGVVSNSSSSSSSSSITTQSSSLSLRIVTSPSQSPFWLPVATGLVAVVVAATACCIPLLDELLLRPLLAAATAIVASPLPTGSSTAAEELVSDLPAAPSPSFASPPSSTTITFVGGFGFGVVDVLVVAGTSCRGSSLSESELILTGLSSSSSTSGAAGMLAVDGFISASTASVFSFAAAEEEEEDDDEDEEEGKVEAHENGAEACGGYGGGGGSDGRRLRRRVEYSTM